jgi:hypothetical protein
VARLGLTFNDEQLKAFMSNIDKNKDGKIEFKGWLNRLRHYFSCCEKSILNLLELFRVCQRVRQSLLQETVDG